ncbi:class I SAM-dependent methyltransferase [Aliifodinibius salicampi]|uniref:Class I SAM-dependent methyltransferase n=1 Tax=Fodinibius salicampi TaxID=1920655 RepID=A0ABT3PXL8_9BACT|nr:class I SAM-dependent methyltransferase [Fodinibius salicampi]MCW9712612.1 class I SAM-dependent methyltransferase [Fodinibius salicampi]
MECKICGNTENNITYETREMMMGLREVFTYFQCDDCKCLQIAEIPDNLSKYYSGEYYSFQDAKKENFITKFVKRKRDQYAVFDRSLIGKFIYSKYPKPDLQALSHIPLKKDTAILDVGCGTGELLRSLVQLGFENLTGIDPYNKEAVIEIGDDARIFKKSIFEIEGQWDLIMMHHVFEHVSDPLEVLQKASQLLSEGGHCLIRIPVTESVAWEKFRENWVQLDPPRHIFVHSPKSIRYLVRETDFKLKEVSYDSTAFQFWGSIQYENDIPLRHESSYAVNPEKSMFTAGDIRSFTQKARELNKEQKGDQAVFILQKESRVL